MTSQATRSRLAQNGFSLIELMVAMALSLILLGGVLSIFASSKTTYETTDRLARLQENGRFALDSIARDLRSAGFNACSKRASFGSSLDTATPLLYDFAQAIQGFDAQGGTWVPTLDTGVAVSANSAGDAIVIRMPRGDVEPVRMTAAMVATTDAVQVEDTTPPLIKANDIVQVSDCKSRAVFQVTGNTAGALAHAQVAATTDTPGNASDDIGLAFDTFGEVVPMRSVVYFLRAGSTAGAGTSLWRRANGEAAEELVEGVETMQFAFGQDTNADAIISVGEYRIASAVTDWGQVLTVRVALLVRSLSEYGTSRDQDAGSYAVLETTIANPGDRRMRQIFSTTVAVRNLGV